MKILVIDDSELTINAMKRILRGYTVFTALEADVALQIAAKQRPDVVFVDLLMTGASGLDVIEALRPMLPDAGLILMTAYDGGLELTLEVEASGGDGFLAKQDFGKIHLILAHFEAKLRSAGQ